MALNHLGLPRKQLMGPCFADGGEYTKQRAMEEFVKADSTMQCLVATVGFGMEINVKGLDFMII